MATQTFSYTGSQQSFTVPGGVTTITVDAAGAEGGAGGPGKGGRTQGDISVTAGATIYI